MRLLADEYVSNIYINDYDRSIYAFWHTILNDKNDFCSWIENVDVSVETWRHYKAIQNDAPNHGLFELAQSTFFLNRTNVSGVITGGIIGGLNQHGKYKIDVRFNKKALIARIERIYQFRNRIKVSNEDGLDFVKKMNLWGNDLFIYLDPPYYQKGADLYMNFYAEKDHKKLSDYVHGLRKKWMVSYDNHDFILNLYPENQKIVHTLSQSTSNRVGDELLIFPDNITLNESLLKLKSPAFLTHPTSRCVGRGSV